LQTEKERIDFAMNHSLYMKQHITAYKWTNKQLRNYGIPLKNYLTW